MELKHCPCCEQKLAVDNFYKSNTSKSGYRSYCKLCEKKRNNIREPQYKELRKAYRQTETYKNMKKKYYIKNKEVINEYNKN